ncbi:MAG TPA: hypothetical protein VK886_06470 [Vicinamibacterales bacterium]|nr:hypothetical protein [Vicinamibacterales bacterium]
MRVNRGRSRASMLVLWLSVAALQTAVSGQSIFLREGFEDGSFAARGWYDSTGGTLSQTTKFAGAASFECRFATGASGCAGGHPGRLKFPATESVYIAYYIRHSPSWVGSGRRYHPHLFLFLTNLDGDYAGPAYTHLTAYVENNYLGGGTASFIIQDGRNIDESRVGQNLVGVTENRAVAGCNGDSDGYGDGECSPAGSVHWNGKVWQAGTGLFDSTMGSPTYKGVWHLIEAYFALNSISGGIGQKDGTIRYWYDGRLILERTNIVIRTGARSTQRLTQLNLMPYIGDGSPADQTMWIDNLMIASARPAVPPPPPSLQPPAPPTNLVIIR